MGRLVFSAICSLDGFMTDSTGDFGWAEPDETVLADVNDEIRGASTFLYGRRMYETMVGWETEPALADQSPGSAEFAELWKAADKVVYSTTLEAVSTRRTRLERRFDPALVERWKRESPGDLFVDGPTLAAHALRAGLVDRLHLILCPVVIGSGLAILPSDVRLNLRLADERRYDNGMLAVRYDVAPV